jgi:hypothetical protein
MALLKALFSQLTYLLPGRKGNPFIHTLGNPSTLSKDSRLRMNQRHLHPLTCQLQKTTPNLQPPYYLHMVLKHSAQQHFLSRLIDVFLQILAPPRFTRSACHLLKKKMIARHPNRPRRKRKGLLQLWFLYQPTQNHLCAWYDNLHVFYNLAFVAHRTIMFLIKVLGIVLEKLFYWHKHLRDHLIELMN